MENNYIIQVENLIRNFKSVNALNGVSFNVKRGELLVILGTSGDGKSTLLNLIGAIDKPTSGSILFNGQDITKFKKSELNEYRKKNVGFIFQSFNLINDIDVYENVMLQASLLKNYRDPKEVLESVGLGDKIHAYPKELSGGQQQRVAIARAFVKNAELILCDEPTGALDFNTGKVVLKSIEELVRKHNSTVILVTHTKEIAKMADHVICMRNGKIEKEYYNEDIINSDEIEW